MRSLTRRLRARLADFLAGRGDYLGLLFLVTAVGFAIAWSDFALRPDGGWRLLLVTAALAHAAGALWLCWRAWRARRSAARLTGLIVIAVGVVLNLPTAFS